MFSLNQISNITRSVTIFRARIIQKNLLFYFDKKFSCSNILQHGSSINNRYTLSKYSTKIQQPKDVISEDADVVDGEIDELMSSFAKVVKDLTQFNENMDAQLKERLTEMLHYHFNIEKWFLSVNLATIYMYKNLEQPNKVNSKSIEIASIFGWCLKMIELSFNLTDDILDNSVNRYGKPCWYRKENVGINYAILDSFFFEHGAYQLLQKYVGSHPLYMNIISFLQNEFFKCVIAQYNDFGHLPLDKFESFYLHRTAKGHMAFTHPVRCAMYLANISDKDTHLQVGKLCEELGDFFVIQDDYLDAFGSTRKYKFIEQENRDIKDGKCTWLAVQALRKASVGQRKLMEDHLGKEDERSVSKIINLYEELQLRKLFKDISVQFEHDMYKKVQELPKSMRREPFYGILTKVFSDKWLT